MKGDDHHHRTHVAVERRAGELALPYCLSRAGDRIPPRRKRRRARRGFGSVRVVATIGDESWRTSIFPQKEGGYLLPIKAEVRRRAGIAAGDEASVTLALA